VSEAASDLDGLPAGAVVLTGSLRRRAQLLLHRPDLQVEGLRGNVDTRLRRWRESGAAGLVLAGAGLARLGLMAATEVPAHALAPEVLLPAPGQGTLALEVRRGGRAEALCRVLNHAETAAAAAAERRVVAAFGGDCTLPLAAWARWESALGDDGGSGRRSGRGNGSGNGSSNGNGSGNGSSNGNGGMGGGIDRGDVHASKGGGEGSEGAPLLRLSALIATPDGRQAARGEAAGADPAAVAEACIAALRADGADEVLQRVKGTWGQ
jgi:porphobilinogen deaminase